jgi:hypothetical protein
MLSVLGDQTIYWDGGELARKRANRKAGTGWVPMAPTLSLYIVPVYSLITQHTQHSLPRFSSRKMELIPGSETSTHLIQKPGIYPENDTLHQQHGESLKTKLLPITTNFIMYNLMMATMGGRNM